MLLRLKKLAESIRSLHMRLLRPRTNSHPFQLCILHSSHVVNNAREDLFPFPRIFILKEVTAGDLNISNYTILNTFKLHARRI